MVSTRYARALFEYALELKMEDKVFSEMKILSTCFRGEHNLRTSLDSPVLSVSNKKKLIVNAIGGKVSNVFERFVDLVLYRRREFYLQSISMIYMDLYRKHKNICTGKLITAIPLDTPTQNSIKSLVQKKQLGTLEFETVVNPDIDGGFILYVDTYRLDASVSSQLRKIREDLLKKNKKIV